ncbi:MAG: cellulase family glycosylhydrolase [Nitrosomonadales bacterium]|nr:cellulase family glycosylhydrolase [Nitrosomonadales bacterium]
MKIRLGGIVLLVAAMLAGCNGGKSAAVDSCSAITSKWALWAGGTCLRGANVWQRSNIVSIYGTALGSGLFGPVFTQTDFDNLAKTGANVVFISHPGLYSEIPPYLPNLDAQTNLDNLLAMVAKANMYAVISFRTGPGRSEEDIVYQASLPALNSVWTNPAEQTAWADMWSYTAKRYKTNPVVVGYDLMVDPHTSLILSPPYDWNSLAKKITDAIRLADINTPVLIGGMNYSSAAALAGIVPTGDSKTVYTVHQYDPIPYTLQAAQAVSYGTTIYDFYSRTDLLNIFLDVATFKSSRNVPVGISEFGAKRFVPNAVQFLDDEMGIMESYGLNYAIWDWETTDPAYATIHSYDAFNFRMGTDPAIHLDAPNVLTTVIQKYFQKNTARPSNRAY